MDEYFLTKEDWDALVEMGVGKAYREEGVLKLIPTTVKSAFTRKCVVFCSPFDRVD
jgi:replication factor C subunit 1